MAVGGGVPEAMEEEKDELVSEANDNADDRNDLWRIVRGVAVAVDDDKRHADTRETERCRSTAASASRHPPPWWHRRRKSMPLHHTETRDNKNRELIKYVCVKTITY